jgi:hypothetical protein
MEDEGMINTHIMHKSVKGCTQCFGIKPFNGERLGDRGLSSTNITQRT